MRTVTQTKSVFVQHTSQSLIERFLIFLLLLETNICNILKIIIFLHFFYFSTNKTNPYSSFFQLMLCWRICMIASNYSIWTGRFSLFREEKWTRLRLIKRREVMLSLLMLLLMWLLLLLLSLLWEYNSVDLDVWSQNMHMFDTVYKNAKKKKTSICSSRDLMKNESSSTSVS